MPETTTEAELVIDARADLAEGPAWDERDQSLIWVDIGAGRFHRYWPADGSTDTIEIGVPVGAAVPRASGGWVLAAHRRFLALHPDGSTEELATLEDRTPDDVRLNDGKCDNAGRFWAGTMGDDAGPGRGDLYRVDPGGAIELVVPDATISNGMGWSLDGTTMYYIDTMTHRVDALDFDPATGDASNRRPLVEIPEADGIPDGMTVDAEGFLWVAFWGGWCVRRYSPDGDLDREVRLPAAQVTSCAFGGPELADLYITTARGALSDEQLTDQPHAGGIFRLRPGVTGLPTNAFAG